MPHILSFVFLVFLVGFSSQSDAVEDGPVIGIYMGNTNSVISIVDENNQFKIIP